jgi:putative nucleotidyltransferase with HDIG domain
MNDKSLTELIDESIASGSLSLPVFPPVIIQLRAALADPNCSPEHIAKQLAFDVSLASQVLRVANSPFYAGLNKINTIKEAIMRLGLNQTVQIATLVAQKGQFGSSDPLYKRYLLMLWKHSVACSLGSEWLAKRLGFLQLSGEAFMGGLFHDIGKLLLLKCLEEIQKSDQTITIPEELRFEILDRLHEEKGAQLLRQWNLPEIYCEIARTHHQALTPETITVAMIVRLADQLACKLGIALRGSSDLMVSGSEEASRLNVSDITLAELEIAMEDSLALSSV